MVESTEARSMKRVLAMIAALAAGCGTSNSNPNSTAPSGTSSGSAGGSAADSAAAPSGSQSGSGDVDATGAPAQMDATASTDASGGDGRASDAAAPRDGDTVLGPATFTPSVRVDDDTGNSDQVEVTLAARPDGLVLVGFIDERSGQRCGYSVSRDGGKTWGKNFFVATSVSGGFMGDPGVAADDSGNLYIVCEDYGTSAGTNSVGVMFAMSSDSGATWSPWRMVNKSEDKPWIAGARDGTVFLTWLGNPGGYRRSTDHGQTWESPISLGYLNHGTMIAPASGNVHIAYNDENNYVKYASSMDWGATLGAGRELLDQGTACFEPCQPRSHPIVGGATDPTGQIVAITWAATLSGGDGDDDVWVIVSKDAGKTFTKPIRANDNMTESRQFQPWVAVDADGRVHAVWTDLRNGGQNSTYYARMTDPAKGFEPNVEVTDGRGAAQSFLGDYKGIAIQGNDVVVTWTDTRNGNADIYFARAVGAATP
jgi:hypothetical protein